MSRLTNARKELEAYEQTKPGNYQSQYMSQIRDVTGKLNDMDSFDYDPDADTAYQQYKDQYTKNAKLANQNAQATAAARTGGYASSWGTQAGQNAYSSQMQDLDNVLDSLYSQSMSEYNAKRNGLQTQLSGLQAAEEQDYQNYQKDLSDWYDGLSYRQNEYNAASSEKQQKTSNWINGLLSVASIAAQILPWFFI